MSEIRVPEPTGSSPTVTPTSWICLGEFFSKYRFPPEEKTRLAALAANGGAPAHLIKTYVTRTEAYQEKFHKAERIPGGLRPKTPLYKETAIRRIVAILGDPSQRNHGLCWAIYRQAAIPFMETELPQLNKLLKEVRPTEGSTEVVDMFKALCANAPEYGVTPEQITKFYDIWGVPRISSFETLLPQWVKADETNAHRRQLTRLLSEVAELRTDVAKLETTVGTHGEALALDRTETSPSLAQHRLLEEQVQALSQQVSELLTSSARDDTIKKIDERVAGLAEKVNRLAEKVKVPREEVSTRDLHKLANETKLGIASSVSELTDALTKRMREELLAATGELDAKITALSSELVRRREGTTTTSGGSSPSAGYRSPLIGVVGQGQATCKLTAELDFVNSWLHHLSHAHDIALTFEQAVAYHRAFLGSPVVVCDRIFALSWIRCLAWQPFTMHMAASPTWSSEEDWAQGAEHLFRRDSGRPPHLLVLHNYDVGLPECYLAPSLTLWALRRESSALSKLFLLPARHDHIPSAHVLEHAVFFGNNDHLTTLPLELKEGVRTPAPAHREPPLGAEPKIVAQWAKHDAHVAYDLASIQRALKCRMPADLVASFERTVAIIARYIEDSSAIAIAMHHQVIPWVQLTHGEAKATELSNLVSTMAGGAD